ncbi:MAG: cytochrome c oxidase subunit II [Bacteroidetes bacterium]|nr:cytochrome c oxidase subunit II [Bacteroidota bacterium]
MTTFLVGLVIILVVIIVARIMRILELTEELCPQDDAQEQQKENNWNAKILLAFLVLMFSYVAYESFNYIKFLLPVSASKEGVISDKMLWINFGVIGIVFVFTQILLFWFGYSYVYKKGKKAFFFTHNNKLEFYWTLIPTIVLLGLIGYGLKVWNDIMLKPAPDNAKVIEIYARQFDFTARYAGNDNKLGYAYYKLIDGTNRLGVDATDVTSHDDILSTELHLPVNQPILLKMRSQDVIHSAYLPEFRVQMNNVPGMTTQFCFTPTITTEEMQKITKNPKFEYIMICNKICGAAHFTMKMHVVVETPEQYNEWLSKQQTFIASMTK